MSPECWMPVGLASDGCGQDGSCCLEVFRYLSKRKGTEVYCRLIKGAGIVLGLLLLTGCARPVKAAQSGKVQGETVVLDTASFWRCHFTWMIPVVRQREELAGLDRVDKKKGVIDLSEDDGSLQFRTPFPPADWMQPDFDDSTWCRVPGPFFYNEFGGVWSGGCSEYIGLICLRGKFTVKEPSRVRQMLLSTEYRGGVVVYLNGEELARQHLPQAEMGFDTLAEGYPPEAFVSPEGKFLRHAFGDPSRYPEFFRLRIRKLESLPIPASVLKKGVNVLAVEVHRIAVDEAWTSRTVGRAEAWATAGLVSLKIEAQSARGAVPNLFRPAGFQVWNCDLLAGIYDQDFGDPHDVVKPIKLAGARNGTYSGKVVVSSPDPIQGLRAAVSELRHVQGEAQIPSSRVQVRYASLGFEPEKVAQNRYPGLENVLRFDGLADAPPEVVAVNARQLSRRPPEAGPPRPYVFGAVQPIWVTVHVPRDAAPGDYRGTLTISLESSKPIEVPIELELIDWTLPDPHDFITHIGLYQSPESAALYYKVSLWSDEHFELMASSLKQLARVGNKLVIIPLVCRTDEGGEQSIVRWVKQPDGSFKYDFSIMDRYLDLVEEHMGKPRVLVVKVWEVYGHLPTKGRVLWIGKPLVTRLDPETGELSEMEGPPYGTFEGLEFWKPVLHEVRRRIERRGLLDVMLLGQGRDTSPYKATVTMFEKILPGVKWMRSSHSYKTALESETGRVEIGCLEHVWNAAWGRESIPDPDEERQYGWRGPFLKTSFPRWPGGSVTVPRVTAPLSVYRTFPESLILADQHGFGRVGADFWPVRPGRYGRTVSIAGRYPISDAAPGPVSISCPAVLHPGPRGAQSTARFEMLIEAVQECEARIFLEKALLDHHQKLPPAPAARCQELLDERTRYLRWVYVTDTATWLWYPHSGWQPRSAKLYKMAAKVAKALRQE